VVAKIRIYALQVWIQILDERLAVLGHEFGVEDYERGEEDDDVVGHDDDGDDFAGWV
jgi:hypothetical protein